LEGVDFLVEGYVANLPVTSEINQQFMFVVDSGPERFPRGKISLNYYGPATIKASQRWQFEVRLKRPRGFANPGTFDYEAWLFQQNVSARGYVRDSASNRLINAPELSMLSVRDSLRQKLISLTGGLENQAVILALAIGDRELISNKQWQLFSLTGTNHLVVVLAGFSLPTQRALVMVSVFMLARILALRQTPLFSLLLSLQFVLLLDPFAAITVGFWLSFTAVAGLLLVFSGVPVAVNETMVARIWENWFKAQFVVFAAMLAPLSIWIGEVSLASPLANVFAIPVISWLVLPLCLLAVGTLSLAPEFAFLLFQWADYLLQIVISVLTWIALNERVNVSWHVAVEPQLLILLCAFGYVLLFLPFFVGARLLGLLLFLPLIFPRQDGFPEDSLALHVLDVGQGLAIILRTRSHSMVYDTGAGFTDGFDSGAQIVLPVLAELGITKIDTLIVSHGDNDHAGGVNSVIEGIAVDRFLSSDSTHNSNLLMEPCLAGQQWTWDSAKFTILHPPNGLKLNSNNGSCVLHVQFGEHSLLLPGDIEAEVELALLRRSDGELTADILVAAHHGSNTSSTHRFVSALSPEYVIFSAGYLSQFGHPAEKVQQRFREAGAVQLNTADSGMISIYMAKTKEQVEIKQHRDPRQRYWN
jgi:competence protein ComEC